LEDGFTDREKSHCIDANYFKGGNLKSYFEKNRRQLVFDFDDPTATGLQLAGEADLKGHGYNRRVYHPDGKAPSLCAASGGNLEPKILQVPRGKNQGGIKAHDGKVPAMSGSSWEQNNFLAVDGVKWRKLTPIECERLQTVPDNYTNHVSNTQRYRMLGNGWTVDVICHLLEGMKDAGDK
jgi:site-specific DNA-cytosine methylase